MFFREKGRIFFIHSLDQIVFFLFAQQLTLAELYGYDNTPTQSLLCLSFANHDFTAKSQSFFSRSGGCNCCLGKLKMCFLQHFRCASFSKIPLSVKLKLIFIFQIMRNLLGTHLGHSGVYTMCNVLEDRQRLSKISTDCTFYFLYVSVQYCILMLIMHDVT